MIRVPDPLVRPKSDALALAGVLAVWVAMVSYALGWIARYAYNLPLHEDWLMVRPLVGREPNLLNWLWEQNVEHRVPLAKAIYLVLLKASGGDFRIGMVANLLMLAGLCLAMILTARHLRKGQTRLADAFFPLVLLNLGYWEIIGWGWNINYVLWAMLVYLWLIIIVCEPWPLPPKPAIAAGLASVLLPLSGAMGVLFTPFIAFWLIAGLLFYHRDMTAKWLIPFLAGCVAVSIALSGLYFVGYARPISEYPPNPGIGPTAKTAVRLIGMAIGPVGGGRVLAKWITSVSFGSITLLLFASSIVPLWRGLRGTQISERIRVFGLLIFGAAVGALILGIAWGRASTLASYPLPDRYGFFIAPGLCAVYFAWILYGPQTARHLIPTAIAIVVLVALPFNLQAGKAWRSNYVAGMRAVERDLSAALSLEELSQKHAFFFFGKPNDYSGALAERMRMLREAKIGPLGSTAPR
jgi:hypothetical protein